jgi:ABC-type antimicrobial peptide transport system permease subunit
VGQERAIAQLTGFFGALTLVLAAIGLYGVMSYAVARRTSEIGVRMALGALPGDVRWLVLRETLALTAAGLAFGLVAALASVRLVESLLFGLSPHDPATMVAALVVMVVVAAASGYLPARRASRVDPMVSLRYE